MLGHSASHRGVVSISSSTEGLRTALDKRSFGRSISFSFGGVQALGSWVSPEDVTEVGTGISKGL